ncbi:hypothetical protein BDV29DRAFT_163339 [Aspergillus leporis]|jgi:hypothetical protein|uniref:Uncharacterized protein n=1 Tax=Aspergillus leporis TaxID=41062 RepID=A0A5N5WJV6_9EURO|nr:hypothetical protein BDV29DRAFT_163339 [Aspergillus leporis]
MGIIAGSLPTLKPLFKQILGSYGSRSKTRPYTYGSKQYRLRSLSRSRQGQSHTLHSEPRSRVEPEADQKMPSSRHFATTTTTTTTTATYPGRTSSSNSSEEYILSPHDMDGIMLTTEVMVSRTEEARKSAARAKTAHFGRDDVV